jgi:hypothetical protein
MLLTWGKDLSQDKDQPLPDNSCPEHNMLLTWGKDLSQDQDQPLPDAAVLDTRQNVLDPASRGLQLLSRGCCGNLQNFTDFTRCLLRRYLLSCNFLPKKRPKIVYWDKTHYIKQTFAIFWMITSIIFVSKKHLMVLIKKQTWYGSFWSSWCSHCCWPPYYCWRLWCFRRSCCCFPPVIAGVAIVAFVPTIAGVDIAGVPVVAGVLLLLASMLILTSLL